MLKEMVGSVSRLMKLNSSKEEKKLPGYIYKDKSYSINPYYDKARKIEKIMPVNPEYEIFNGQIIGKPKVFIQEKIAAFPGQSNLPDVKQLSNLDYFNNNLKNKRYEYEANKYGIKLIASPTEINLFSDQIINIDKEQLSSSPVIKAQYVYAAQETFKGPYILEEAPIRFENNKINLKKPISEDELEGLAYVAHVRKSVDFQKHFSSIEEIEQFDGKLPSPHYENSVNIFKDYKKVNEIFSDIFTKDLEKIGEKVEETRNKTVKGILLSDIVYNLGAIYVPSGTMDSTNPEVSLTNQKNKLNYLFTKKIYNFEDMIKNHLPYNISEINYAKFSDNQLLDINPKSIQPNFHGEMIIAATYLV